MQVFDFNIHLPTTVQLTAGETIKKETAIGLSDLLGTYDQERIRFKRNLHGGNFMILNPDLLQRGDGIARFVSRVRSDFADSCFTAIVDFRHKKAKRSIEHGVQQGLGGIKFHSYIQRIGELDFKQALDVALFAQEHRLFICIDASFGTTRMYEFDNLKLAAHLAEAVDRVPIILLHSGGARILQAMLLAVERKNIWLETSFSLPYYIGSSIEHDLVFAYKKIGCDRVLYGSDHPYVSLTEGLTVTQRFLKKHCFNSKETEQIFCGNALRLSGYG